MKKHSFIAAAGLAFALSGQLPAVAQTEPVQPVEARAATQARNARASAVQPSGQGRGPHGGTLRRLEDLQAETVIAPGGLQVFIYDRAGQPVSVDQARGIASLLVEGGAKRYRYDLLPDSRGALAVAVDLSKIAGRQIELDFKLYGLAAGGTKPIRHREVATVPRSQQQLAAAAIADQKFCPVSGKPLGSMGSPVKVVVSGKPILLCCQGCSKKVQAEPAKYLAQVHGDAPGKQPRQSPLAARDSGEEVRRGVYKVTAADAPFVAAQRRCPVMDEPLDAMGGPYRVNANGRAIYICCPGCAKKIAAEPQKYVATLAGQGITAPRLR